MKLSIIIVSDARNSNFYNATQETINSALQQKNEIEKEIIIIEKQNNVSYKNINKIIHVQDLEFNYNKFLNLGIEQSSGEYIALCNNDLTFFDNWDSKIIKVMNDNNILSASPLHTELETPGGRSAFKNLQNRIFFGYRIGRELFDWCVVINRKVVEIIGKLDESPLYFYYNNELYAKQLIKSNIQHALIGHSVVKHLCIEEEIITVNQSAPYSECITVVIPTILKTQKDIFQYSLKQYNESDLVSKIVIIDNTENKDFDKQYEITKKMLILKPHGNLGPVYNSGMAFCETKYYLLVNDDVICHKKVLDDCYKIIENDEKIGLLQIYTINNQPLLDYISQVNQELTITPNYRLPIRKDSNYGRNNGLVGWFQFGLKRDWEDIPTEFKAFFGDDLLILRMAHKKLKVVQILSSHISHFVSSSINKTNLNNRLTIEREIFNNLVEDYLK